MLKINRMWTAEAQDLPILVSLLAWGEARGEGPLGMRAVCCVAVNRSHHHGFPPLIKAVILQHHMNDNGVMVYQFDCFDPKDRNYHQLLTADIDDPVNWGEACVVAGDTLLGGPDITQGATHYLTKALYVSAPPHWAIPDTGWIETARIGHHVFGIAA